MRMLAGIVSLALAASAAVAQAPPAGTVLDTAVAPGANFDKAEFRIWYPKDTKSFRGVVVLVPGSNGDGRPMAQDTVWQAFAAKHGFAIVACRFTDKAHEQGFIEEYVDVSRGSGQALLDAVAAFAARTSHPELARAPFLLWGMSAGGQFDYEFAAWKPERVIAFVVNKGGIYYSALVPRAARAVPALLFVGGKDLEFRTNTIAGLFAVNRRAGALWALTEEPGAAHVVGRSRDLSIAFFDDVLSLRLGADGTLKPLAEKDGWLGDLKARTVRAVADAPVPNLPTAWLPTARTARAWEAVVNDRP